MTQTQANRALTLAYLLKTKYRKWDFRICDTCAMEVARRNNLLRPKSIGCSDFGSRVSNLFFGKDLLDSKELEAITQPMFRKALLKVIDQEGWEEA